MKNLILLLLFELFLENILCNDSLLSKFHQTDFKIRDLRWELVSFSEKYYNKFELKTFKYNRTVTAGNTTMNMKVAVKDKIEVLVQAYKFLSNEYRHFPIRFQINMKKAIEANAIGLGKLKRCGNFTTAYFEKDVTYFFCNFVVDETCLPPLIPSGIYRIALTYLYLNEEIALIYMFGEVYTPMKYPKH